MYSLLHIFNDNGTELSTATLNTTLGTTIDSIFDGRYIWVTTTNGIAIYEYYDLGVEYEPTADYSDVASIGRYNANGPEKKLKLVTFITVGAQVKRSTRYLSLSLAPSWAGGAGSTTVGATTITFTQNTTDLLVATEVTTNLLGSLTPYYIKLDGSKVYVSHTSTFNKVFVFDKATQQLSSVITFDNGAVANSNLHIQNNKIWFVDTFVDMNTYQKLITKDLTTLTETSTNITHVRGSSTRTWLANGYNGYVYVTNYNGFSITKYNESTNAYVTQIIISRYPHHIFSFPDKRIYVASDTSLLSLIDWDDDGVHNTRNTENPCLSLAVDPDTEYQDSLWFVRTTGNVLGRLTMATGDMIEIAYTNPNNYDWVITSPFNFTATSVLSIPAHTYAPAGGSPTFTAAENIFVLGGTSVYLIKVSDFIAKRGSYISVYGQSAAVGGSLQYWGET